MNHVWYEQSYHFMKNKRLRDEPLLTRASELIYIMIYEGHTMLMDYHYHDGEKILVTRPARKGYGSRNRHPTLPKIQKTERARDIGLAGLITTFSKDSLYRQTKI